MNPTDQGFQQGDKGSQYNQFGAQQAVPNSTASLVLGILSLVLCGLIGIILGVIGIILANQGEKEYQANPGNYSQSSYKNLKAGKTCSIIGICVGAAALVVVIVYLIAVGVFLSSLR